MLLERLDDFWCSIGFFFFFLSLSVGVLLLRGSDSYVNVVVFSEEARVLSPNSTALVNADAEHVSELVNLVNDLEVGGCILFWEGGARGGVPEE